MGLKTPGRCYDSFKVVEYGRLQLPLSGTAVAIQTDVLLQDSVVTFLLTSHDSSFKPASATIVAMASIYLVNALYKDNTSPTAARSMQSPNNTRFDLPVPSTTIEQPTSAIAFPQPVTEPEQPAKQTSGQQCKRELQHADNMHPSRQEMVDVLGLSYRQLDAF